MSVVVESGSNAGEKGRSDPKYTDQADRAPTVVAKFQCVGENRVLYGIEYTFSPVINGSPENRRFFETTPSGKITVMVSPRMTSAQFTLGALYYVTFQRCDGSLKQ